jgi:hypothetical protein
LVDLNDNIVSGKTAAALQRIGLIERVSAFQWDVPTYHRRSTTIDGIFTTSEILPVDGGYMRLTSDHLCLWVDLEAQSTSKTLSQTIPASLQRLQCTDPRLVTRYSKNLWGQIRESNIKEKSKLVENDALPTQKRERAWEDIDWQLLKMRLGAEKKCRKLRMGTVQWSPELATIRNSIKYWSLFKKKIQGFSVDRKYFKRVAKSVNLPST